MQNPFGEGPLHNMTEAAPVRAVNVDIVQPVECPHRSAPTFPAPLSSCPSTPLEHATASSTVLGSQRRIVRVHRGPQGSGGARCVKFALMCW